MNEKFCDQEDCPIYPYKEKKIEEKTNVELDNTAELDDNKLPGYWTMPMGTSINSHSHAIWNPVSSPWSSAIDTSSNISTQRTTFKIKTEELEVAIDFRCIVCEYFKKCDMKTLIKILDAKELLSK